METAQEQYEIIKEDHKVIKTLEQSAKAVRDKEVQQGKLDMAKALAREKRLGKKM